jgi:hypothetical protein
MTQSEYDQLTEFLAAQGWEQRDPADFPKERVPDNEVWAIEGEVRKLSGITGTVLLWFSKQQSLREVVDPLKNTIESTAEVSSPTLYSAFLRSAMEPIIERFGSHYRGKES